MADTIDGSGSHPEGKHSRRKFLTGAAGAGVAAAATVAMPNVSRAQTQTLRFQSTWPEQDIFHEFARDFVSRVNTLASGRVELQLLPAGSVVNALQLQDAITAGALDGGHGVAGYWYGKNKAFSLFATPPSMGWNANQMLGWIRYGGGQELYDELVQQVLGLNLVGYLSGPMPSQPLGWFANEITSPDQLQGLKYRTNGLAADMFQNMGVAVTIMGSPDIVPAMDRGLLDGAEFNNPSSDLTLGFPDVANTYMVRSHHQPCECFEIIFNKAKHDALGEEVIQILRYASDAASADMAWKAMDRYSADLQKIRDAGVTVVETPDAVLQAQLDSWTQVVESLSADPFFAKVIESQKAWVQRVVGFEMQWEVPRRAAYEHFFSA